MSFKAIRSRFRTAAVPDDFGAAKERTASAASLPSERAPLLDDDETAPAGATTTTTTPRRRSPVSRVEQTNPTPPTPPFEHQTEQSASHDVHQHRMSDSPPPSPGRRSRSNSLRRIVLDQQQQQQSPSASPRSHRTARQRFLGRDKRHHSDRSVSLDRSLLLGAGSVPSGECTTTDDEPIAAIGSAETPPDDAALKRGVTESPSRLQPHRRIAAWARELMDDLQSIDDACRGPNKDASGGGVADDPSLAIKRLKNNIVRFGRATSAITSLVDGVQSLRHWESPTVSALFVVVTLYSIWHGLFLTLVFGAILWRLTLNYLASRGCSSLAWLSGCWADAPDGANDAEADAAADKSSGVAERVASVVHVARKVQNHLGAVCDAAEKVKSLLLWRHEASGRLYAFVWCGLTLTALVPTAILFRLAGFYLVFKLMVLDYVYFRFPRIREKYDTSPLMWDRLPTDAEWAAKRKAEQASHNGGGAFEARSFRDSFNLPVTESPLPGWQNGVKSSLVNRDKSLTSSFKTGRLFLTENYLCFERSKTHPEKNIAIPLEKIERIEKSNQSIWMPGGGMIIEVIVQGHDRAFSFGALTNRDDVYDAVRSSAEKIGRLSNS